MSVAWLAKRWCVVEQNEQQDLFVADPWHTHMVDINMRLDNPVERTLCGDLLPARPVYRELLRAVLPSLCPHCLSQARTNRRVASRQQPMTAERSRAEEAGTQAALQQFELYGQGWQ